MEKKHDAYCWECCGLKTTLKCSTCVRSFHVGCTIDENTVDNMTPCWLDGWVCPVCIVLNTSTNTKMELDRIPFIVERVWKSEYVDLNKKKLFVKGMKRKSFVKIETDIFSTSEVIVNPIDLSEIQEKAHSYKSLNEFFTDILWIVHNCEVLFTVHHEKTKRAKDLLKMVSAEIDSVKKCLQCHINANTKQTRLRWFQMVCDQPHLIIWAYRNNLKTFWPAKMMCIEDGQQVNVRFFGSFHKHENVPADKCFLYSERSPGVVRQLKSNGRMKKELSAAMKEVDLYINNIREKYGGFQFATPRTPYDPAKHDNYIRDLMSGATKSSDRKLFETSSEENGNTSHGPMQSNAAATIGNSSGLGPTLKIEQVVEGYAEPSADQVENDEVNIGDMFDTTEDMETKNDSTAIDNDFETKTTPDVLTKNVSNYGDSLQRFTKGFNRIYQELENRLKSSEKNRGVVVRTLKATNTKLMTKNKKLKVETEKQIETLKKTHEEEITRLKEENQKLKEAHESIVQNEQKQTQTVEKCVREYSALIEAAKRNKYCEGCGNAKPLDFYVCSANCQRTCWERSVHEI